MHLCQFSAEVDVDRQGITAFEQSSSFIVAWWPEITLLLLISYNIYFSCVLIYSIHQRWKHVIRQSKEWISSSFFIFLKNTVKKYWTRKKIYFVCYREKNRWSRLNQMCWFQIWNRNVWAYHDFELSTHKNDSKLLAIMIIYLEVIRMALKCSKVLKTFALALVICCFFLCRNHQ